MTGSGRYLFAIARGPRRDVEVPGHAGAPVEVLEHRGLHAVVCDVDLDEFGEEGLRANLERLDWLERVARTHDEVVRAVAQRATVAPLRLVTICADDESVRRRVDDLHDDLVRSLDRVEGRSEWSVKVYARPDPPAPAEAAEAGEAAGPGRAVEGGAAYLRRKRAEADHRRATGDRLAVEAEEIHAALAAHSVASRRLQPQDPQLSGRTDPMILNAAFLLPDGDTASFDAAVRALSEQHRATEIQVQGPWPPYSFAVLA
jgi:hypothetical protein